MDRIPPGSSVHGNSLGKNTRVGCHALLQGIFPTQGSNPDLLHCRRILYQLSHQGRPRILEWVAYPFSKGSSWPRIKPGSSALQVDSLPAELLGKPINSKQINTSCDFTWLCTQITLSLHGSGIQAFTKGSLIWDCRLKWTAFHNGWGSMVLPVV